MLLNMSFNLGDSIALAAMFGLATYSIKLRKLPSELSILESLFAIIITGCIVLLPLYLLESIYYQSVRISTVSLTSISGMALFVVVLGILSWNTGVQLLGPAISSVFLNLIPIFGAVLSMIFPGEKYYSYHFYCLVLVFAAMLMVLNEQLRKD